MRPYPKWALASGGPQSLFFREAEKTLQGLCTERFEGWSEEVRAFSSRTRIGLAKRVQLP